MKFEELWATVERDVARRLPVTSEFPLTAMTKAVAERIWRAVPRPKGDQRKRALDVGTGTGAHALLMLELGYDVDAIDVCPEAIKYAEERAGTLRTNLQEEAGNEQWERIRFQVVGLDDFATKSQYDLITFNPPAYYNLLGPIGPTPASRGVFVDDNDYRNSKRALLFRFFKKIVLPYLAPNGHLVCSWPAIERRVVEATEGSAVREIVSPTQKLQEWFDVTVFGGRDPNTFFNETASLNGADYGLHETFWANVIAARDRAMFSALVDATHAEEHQLQFRFGVLHLLRETGDLSTFRTVAEPPKGSA